MKSLLDVNVLIALLDPSHQFHDAAHNWFKVNRSRGWATCPMTENGCIRVMSHPGYPFPGLTIAAVRGILTELAAVKGHEFWPDSISLLEKDRVNLDAAAPKQLTDLYLLALAVRRRGRLATFDRRIPWQAVSGCRAEHVEAIDTQT